MSEVISPHSEENRTNRFYRMEEVHRKYFDTYVELCESAKVKPEVRKMIDDFVIGRIGAQKGVRAFIFNEMFEAAGGDKETDLKFLLASIELQLAAMYCFNVAADDKAGYESDEDKRVAYKTHTIVEDIALSGVDKIDISEEKKSKIKEYFNKTWETFYEAEVIDTIVNLYKNKGKLLSEITGEIEAMEDPQAKFGVSKEKILEIIARLPNEPIENFTLERTYKLNAAMIENFGDIIGVMLDSDPETVQKLRDYGKNYGIGMMIVNDIQDYSLNLIDDGSEKATREKDKTDVNSDLKKGKITWPMKYSLELDPNSKELFDRLAGKENLSDSEAEEMRSRLVANGAIARCVLESAYYEKKANTAVEGLGDKDARFMLQDTSTSTMRLSKYIVVLERKYGIKLRPTESQRKHRMLQG